MKDESAAANPQRPSYITIYLMIVALIVAAVVVSGSNLGANAVYFNLLIASGQAFLLSYFFMHLKEADSLTWLCAGSAIFWIFIMFLFMLTDYVTRYIAAY